MPLKGDSQKVEGFPLQPVGPLPYRDHRRDLGRLAREGNFKAQPQPGFHGAEMINHPETRFPGIIIDPAQVDQIIKGQVGLVVQKTADGQNVLKRRRRKGRKKLTV